jgi:hypothetical protein
VVAPSPQKLTVTVTEHLTAFYWWGISLTRVAHSSQFVEADQPDATRPVVLSKIFRFHARANQRYHFARPPRHEGRIAIVTDAGLDAVDAAASGAIVVAGRVLP